jgi:phage tail sheath protein FI
MPNYLSPGVYVEEVPAGARPIEGVGTAVAAFVGLASDGPFNQATLVTNWTQYTSTFGDFLEGAYLPRAVYGYLNNGGGACYIVRIGSEAAGGADVPARAELTTGDGGGALDWSAVEGGAAGNDISVEIGDPSEPGDGAADLKVTVKKSGKVEETFDNLSTKKGKNNVATMVNAQSKLIRVAEKGGALAVAPRGTVALAGGGAPAPSQVNAVDFVGDPASRTGIGALEACEEVTMVCVPDAMTALENGWLDMEGLKAVQLAQISHCELMGDRMAILDPPPGLDAQSIKDWRMNVAGYDSKFATLYWPWIKTLDPATGKNNFMPPSGAIAGIWGRNDDTRGVHKAPANEVVRGAIDIEVNITRAEHDFLNPVGIDVIRSFPGKGIRVWGARTLSSDPLWRYVNVRRFFNYLEKSILNGTDWVVFEPNDYMLWGKISRAISSFLVMEWRKGALFGRSSSDSYFVKCDDETNPAEGIDAGQVVCEIGVAPVKPAEFVIFRLSQFSGGVSLVSE